MTRFMGDGSRRRPTGSEIRLSAPGLGRNTPYPALSAARDIALRTSSSRIVTASRAGPAPARINAGQEAHITIQHLPLPRGQRSTMSNEGTTSGVT